MNRRGNIPTEEKQEEGLLQSIEKRLQDRETCKQITAAYEDLAQALWRILNTLTGPSGSDTIAQYTLIKAIAAAPLLAKIHTSRRGLDFTELHIHANDPLCEYYEIVHAVMELSNELSNTIQQLTGPVLIKALTHQRHGPKQ